MSAPHPLDPQPQTEDFLVAVRVTRDHDTPEDILHAIGYILKTQLESYEGVKSVTVESCAVDRQGQPVDLTNPPQPRP